MINTDDMNKYDDLNKPKNFLICPKCGNWMNFSSTPYIEDEEIVEEGEENTICFGTICRKCGAEYANYADVNYRRATYSGFLCNKCPNCGRDISYMPMRKGNISVEEDDQKFYVTAEWECRHCSNEGKSRFWIWKQPDDIPCDYCESIEDVVYKEVTGQSLPGGIRVNLRCNYCDRDLYQSYVKPGGGEFLEGE